MLDRIKDFIREHILLVIGLFLYLTAFLVGFKISPWDDFSVEQLDTDIYFSNPILSKLPLKFLFFGISELGQGMLYAENMGFEDGGLSYFIAICAVFTYANLIKMSLVGGDDSLLSDWIEYQSPVEKLLVSFFFENVFMYIATIIVAYLYPPVSGKIFGFWEHGNWAVKIVMAVLIFAVIIVPCIPNAVYIFVYDFLLAKIVGLINYMDFNIGWISLLKVPAMFIVLLLLTIMLNIILTAILEGFQKLSMNVRDEILGTALGITLGIIVKIIEFVIGCAILVGIVMLISKIF